MRLWRLLDIVAPDAGFDFCRSLLQDYGEHIRNQLEDVLDGKVQEREKENEEESEDERGRSRAYIVHNTRFIHVAFDLHARYFTMFRP